MIQFLHILLVKGSKFYDLENKLFQLRSSRLLHPFAYMLLFRRWYEDFFKTKNFIHYF